MTSEPGDGPSTGTHGAAQAGSEGAGRDAEALAKGAAAGGPAARAQRRTLRIDLEFDGAGFLGWQRQREGRTVQSEVEGALERILGAPHAVVASGRTDAGAHARHIVTSTRTRATLAVGRLQRALDAVLPEDVGVLALRDMPAGFHAQRDAVWKWYRYRMLIGQTRRPLRRRVTWRRTVAPDLGALQSAAAALEGRHDFRAFCNVGSTTTGSVRTLYRLRVDAHQDEIFVDAVGDGFLYKMVRNLVGSLLVAAQGSDPVGGVQGMLEARDRRAAGRAAPAHGLTLMAVAMAGEPPPAWVPPDLVPSVDWQRRAHPAETSPNASTPDTRIVGTARPSATLRGVGGPSAKEGEP